MNRFIKYIFLMSVMINGASCAASIFSPIQRCAALVHARVQQYSNDIQDRYPVLRDPRVRWGIGLTSFILSAIMLKYMLTSEVPVKAIKEIIRSGNGSETIACIRQPMDEVHIILKDNFTLNIGSIAAKKLIVEQSGNSTLKIGSGKILEGNWSLQGNGVFEAARLKVKKLVAQVSGNAALSCAPQTSVSGALSGNSAFINFGDADTSALRMSGLAMCRSASFFEALFSPLRSWLC